MRKFRQLRQETLELWQFFLFHIISENEKAGKRDFQDLSFNLGLHYSQIDMKGHPLVSPGSILSKKFILEKFIEKIECLLNVGRPETLI